MPGNWLFFRSEQPKVYRQFYTCWHLKQVFRARVFLYLSKDSKSPKDEMVGVYKFPCFAITVNNVKPGEKVVFDDASIYYPVILSDIERGTYNAQVVWDKNDGGRSIGGSPGNMYNKSILVTLE